MCGTESERQMELHHFFHVHRLSLDYFQAYFGHIFTCKGCDEGVFGYCYICKKGCPFYLHKSCGEQPCELRQHPLHRQHPLILTPTIPRPLERCYFCNKPIAVGYSYNCYHCNFNLHLKCASIPFKVKAEFHDHPLKLLRKSLSFTCDACGKKDENKSYLCLKCPLMVHLKCATLPRTLKHISHHHALNLTESSQLNQSYRPICRLCVKKVETTKVYYCSECNFVAHLDCATREGDTEEIKQPLKSEVDEPIDSLAYVVKKMKIGEDKIEIPEQIKHSSHQHDLKLTKELIILNNKKCDGCMHPIFPHPFYSCARCSFFLHKSCVELPRKKQHPLHPDPLTLDEVFTFFVCNVCGRRCDGFRYYCKKCIFEVDVHCSLISDIFTHDGHEHPLILSRVPNRENCYCCDYEEKGEVFRCADCEFIVDFRCITLPRIVRYRHFEQLFKLCYKTEDDSDDEFYYDICEKERNSKHWFY